jgi:hypothetical protein
VTEPREQWWPHPAEWAADPAAARDKAEVARASISLGIGAATHLSTRGTCDPPADVLELRARFRLALEDMRRRRLCPWAPFGWPVLSIHQESLVCRVVAKLRKGAAAGKSTTISAEDARQVAHLLEVAQQLARVEWAETAADHQVPDPAVQDNRPRRW